jgi:hypothetical protein
LIDDCRHTRIGDYPGRWSEEYDGVVFVQNDVLIIYPWKLALSGLGTCRQEITKQVEFRVHLERGIIRQEELPQLLFYEIELGPAFISSVVLNERINRPKYTSNSNATPRK